MSRAVPPRFRIWQAFCPKRRLSETLSKDPPFVSAGRPVSRPAGRWVPTRKARCRPSAARNRCCVPNRRSAAPTTTSATARLRCSWPSTSLTAGRNASVGTAARNSVSPSTTTMSPDPRHPRGQLRDPQDGGRRVAKRPRWHVHYSPTSWPDRTFLRPVDGKATEARRPPVDSRLRVGHRQRKPETVPLDQDEILAQRFCLRTLETAKVQTKNIWASESARQESAPQEDSAEPKERSGRHFAPMSRTLLLPVREWLPEGQFAHHVSDLVDSLDLTAFYAPCDGRRNVRAGWSRCC